MESIPANSVQQMLEQLPTEALDEMLHHALNQKPMDQESARIILKILWEREKDTPVVLTPRIQSAWEKYQRNIARLEREEQRQNRRRSRFLQLISTAAVFVVLVLGILPQRVDADSLWDLLSRWTADLVEFFTPEDNGDRYVAYEFRTSHPGLQSVYDAAAEMGVRGPGVPMWLPEEYTLTDCKVIIQSDISHLCATFYNQQDYVTLNIDLYAENVTHKYQKNDGAVIQKELQGATFSVLRNMDKWTAIWMEDNIECSISIDCQEDVLDQILNSVYMVED